jgi:fluoride exporter
MPRTRLTHVGLVVAGGMLGTTGRWAVQQIVGDPPDVWSWSTLTVNLVGAFLLGALLTGLARTGDDDGWRRAVRLGVGTGVLGGFTTYSTFAAQVDRLVGIGQVWTGLAYAAVTVLGGLGAAAAGSAAARIGRQGGRP